MKQKISKKNNFSSKIISVSFKKTNTEFGPKRLGFRAKQIVPNIGVKFWHNNLGDIDESPEVVDEATADEVAVEGLMDELEKLTVDAGKLEEELEDVEEP